MMKIIKKDITTVTNGFVAHGCNALGVFGAGVALAIAKKWPKAYQQYKEFLAPFEQNYDSALARVDFVEIVQGELYVANCITQVYTGFDKHGNPPAVLDAIEATLACTLIACQIRSLDLYTPQIGCGLGGLDWETQVKPIYESLAEEFSDVNWYVCTI